MDELEIKNKFGELLIDEVRDRSIEHWQKVFSGEMKGSTSKELFSEIQSNYDEQQQAFIMELLTRAVDSTLHNFLFMFEQEEEFIKIIAMDESKANQELNLNEISDGLCGELYTEDGWIMRYTTKPYLEP